MSKANKFDLLRMLDFGLAAGSLLYGLWTPSAFWILGGLLGFLLAWINPGKRIKAYLFVRLKRPTTPAVVPSSAFPSPPSTPYVRRHRCKGARR